MFRKVIVFRLLYGMPGISKADLDSMQEYEVMELYRMYEIQKELEKPKEQ